MPSVYMTSFCCMHVLNHFFLVQYPTYSVNWPCYRQNLDSGLEHGAGIVIYYKGEMVVEFYGGYADEEAEWLWSKDVVTQVKSHVQWSPLTSNSLSSIFCLL